LTCRARFGERLLQPGVLDLELLQPLRVARFHAPYWASHGCHVDNAISRRRHFSELGATREEELVAFSELADGLVARETSTSFGRGAGFLAPARSTGTALSSDHYQESAHGRPTVTSLLSTYETAVARFDANRPRGAWTVALELVLGNRVLAGLHATAWNTRIGTTIPSLHAEMLTVPPIRCPSCMRSTIAAACRYAVQASDCPARCTRKWGCVCLNKASTRVHRRCMQLPSRSSQRWIAFYPELASAYGLAMATASGFCRARGVHSRSVARPRRRPRGQQSAALFAPSHGCRGAGWASSGQVGQRLVLAQAERTLRSGSVNR
jgi:hypothetical protein